MLTFVKNPIIVKFDSHAEPEGGCTFHRVCLDVKVSSSASKETYSFPFSRPVASKSSVAVEFDISSAFVAASESFHYSPIKEDTLFPFFSATITKRDVWIQDGREVTPNENESDNKQTISYVLMGCYSDYIRLLGRFDDALTLKPTSSPEKVCVGDTILYAAFSEEESGEGAATLVPASLTHVIGTAGAHTIGGHPYYAVAPSRNSHLLQFVNSRGCIETIRLWSNTKETVKGGSEEHIISRFERLREFSRAAMSKKPVRPEFALSSGPVTLDWARWFVYEFGQSEQYWVLTEDNIWLPCSVTVDDSAVVVDESKSELLSVDILVKPDAYGMVNL